MLSSPESNLSSEGSFEMNVLMLLRSPIDHDSRVKKEIRSLQKLGLRVKLLSVNSSDFDEAQSFTLSYRSVRRFIPGISTVYAFLQFVAFTLRHYENEQFIHCHDLNTLATGSILKFIAGWNKVVLIYDTHEYAINDVPNETKLNQYRKYLIERTFIKSADEIICVSTRIAEEYSRLYNIEMPKVVLNCPLHNPRLSSDILREKLSLPKETYVFLYQGALSKGRGIHRFIESFKRIDDPNIALIFMGYGELADMIESQEDNRVFYLPAVPSSELASYTASADCGVALIEDSCLSYRYCLPNKIFEYFMGGLPVIASDLPEMRRIIDGYDVGILCSPEDPSSVEDAILAVKGFDNVSLDLNLKELRSKFNWQNQEKILKMVYER